MDASKSFDRSRLDKVRFDALKQLEKYASSEKVNQRFEEGFKKVVLTFVGENDIYSDQL